MGIVTAITPEQKKLVHDIASYVGAIHAPSGGKRARSRPEPSRSSINAAERAAALMWLLRFSRWSGA